MTGTGVLGLLDENTYQQWQRSMITEKKTKEEDKPSIDKRQQELIACLEKDDFAQCSRYILSQIDPKDENELISRVPPLPVTLTASACRRLPMHDESQIHTALKDVTMEESSTSVFWAACHGVWVGQHRFEDLPHSFLRGGKDKTQESQVRNFLRRTAGLEHVRGKVSVITDCPISSAWWRVRLASDADAAAGSELDQSTAHEVLHDPSIWDIIAGTAVRRLTSVNAPNARSAVIAALYLSDVLKVTSDKKKEMCKTALYAVGRAGHNCNLHYVSWEKLFDVAYSAIQNMTPLSSGPKS